MKHPTPLGWVGILSIVFWIIMFATWPTAVRYYFGISAGVLVVYALFWDIKRQLDNIRRP